MMKACWWSRVVVVGARAVMDIGVEQRRQEPRLEACIPRWARLEPGGGQRRGEERVEGVKGGGMLLHRCYERGA